MNTVGIVKNWSAMVSMFPEELKYLKSKRYVLSLNRYGKLKRIERALFAFHDFHVCVKPICYNSLIVFVL
jgi:hypothetical protein